MITQEPKRNKNLGIQDSKTCTCRNTAVQRCHKVPSRIQSCNSMRHYKTITLWKKNIITQKEDSASTWHREKKFFYVTPYCSFSKGLLSVVPWLLCLLDLHLNLNNLVWETLSEAEMWFRSNFQQVWNFHYINYFLWRGTSVFQTHKISSFCIELGNCPIQY